MNVGESDKPEPSDDPEVRDQQQLLDIHRLTLAHYLQQQARLGSAHIPPQVTHGIREARTNILHIKIFLRDKGIAITDHPDDGDSMVSLESLEASRAAEFFSMAMRSHLTGNLWEARRYYEMTLSIDPFFPRASEQLALVRRQIYREEGPPVASAPMPSLGSPSAPLSSRSLRLRTIVIIALVILTAIIIYWLLVMGAQP